MNTTTNRAADNIRILAASMVEKAKSGHPGGAMGGADYINVLYSEFLNFDPDDGEWVNRDRFFLDPGHMSPMLYATLSLIGKYSMEDLKNFRQWGSITPGHPEVDVKRGVENTSGPLGQGHAMAVGAAIAERFLVARFGEWMAHKTYAFISDGGIQEEISQGAGRIAGTLGLANLIMFYDSNNIQLSTKVDEVTHEDTAKKYEAWGWQVITIDVKGQIENLNLDLHKGEILGIGGLSECGMHEVGKALFGASYFRQGSVTLGDGTPINSIPDAIKHSIAYASKDRDNESLVINDTIGDNICLPSLEDLKTHGFLRAKTMNEFANKFAKQMSTKMTGVDQFVSALSGGNKQKVVLARWVGKDSDLIILDSPTRGIDVKVKADIYAMMDDMRKRGKSIIMISEEIMELLGMADRILIMKDGKINGEFLRSPDLKDTDLIDNMI